MHAPACPDADAYFRTGHFAHASVSEVCPPVAPTFPGVHATQIGVVASFHDPAGQSEVGEMQRPVIGSHIVPAPQSDARTGHRVAAFSPLPMQQQRRLLLESEALHVLDPEDRVEHEEPDMYGA